MREPSLPGATLWRVLAWTLAVAAGGAAWWLLAETRPTLMADDLAPAEITFRRVIEEESRWVWEALAPQWILRRPPQAPCPYGITGVPDDLQPEVQSADAEHELRDVMRLHDEHWLPALMLAHGRFAEGRHGLAARVLLAAYEGSSFQELQRLRNTWRLARDQRLALIHLYYSLGQAQIVDRSRDSEYFWDLVKNPIGQVWRLSEEGETDRPAGTPKFHRHLLAAPGCAEENEALTSYDLYNQLIVAYQTAESYEDSEENRREEFFRAYDDPFDENPLQTVVRRAEESWLDEREAEAWALSNSETLLRARRSNGLGPPSDPYLALNLSQAIAGSVELLPDGAGSEREFRLWREAEALLLAAVENRSRLDEEDEPHFLLGGTRLALLMALRGRDDALEVLRPHAEGWEPTAPLVGRVLRVWEIRNDPELLRAVLLDDAAALGLGAVSAEEAASWLQALREDVTDELALVALGPDVPAEERLEAMACIERMGAGTTPLVEDLEETLTFFDRALLFAWSDVGRSLFPALVFLLVLLAGIWACWQIRAWKMLFTNFYRREALTRESRT